MPDIALPAFHVTTTTQITAKLGYEMAQDLERYKAFYKQAYGADVPEADLLREMARRFMENDRDFQAFKGGSKQRSRSRRSTTAPAAARTDSQAA